MNKTIKPNIKISKLDPIVYHLLDQHPNFPEVEHLRQSKPDLIRFETGMNASCALGEFITPGYSLLISKHDHPNYLGHGIGDYIKDEFPYSRFTKNEEPDLPIMGFTRGNYL